MKNEYSEVSYKFRDWSNEYNRRILVENEFYFSNNYSFNDPFDLQLPILISGKFPFNKDIFIEQIIKKTGKVPTKEFINSAESLYPSMINSNPEILENFKNEMKVKIEKIENNLGVFCLSSRNDSSLMWGHYAKSHKGFCVGFDTKKLQEFIRKKFPKGQGELYKVDYSSIIPVYESYTEFDKIKEYTRKRFVTKFEDWKYEDEHRIIIDYMANKSVKIPRDIYKEIIFGHNMSDLHKEEIKTIANALFKDLKYFQSKKNERKFEMQIIQIE